MQSEAKALKYRCWPSKASLIKPTTHAHPHTYTHTDSNLPGGRAICAAAGVDDWLVVIETAKGKFLPDALSLIPLGLQEENRNSFKEQTLRTIQLVHQLTMPAEGRNQKKANNKDKHGQKKCQAQIQFQSLAPF